MKLENHHVPYTDASPGTVCFTYGTNLAVLSFCSEMKNPKHFRKSFVIVQGSQVFLYTLVGALVYVFGGQYTQVSIKSGYSVQDASDLNLNVESRPYHDHPTGPYRGILLRSSYHHHLRSSSRQHWSEVHVCHAVQEDCNLNFRVSTSIFELFSKGSRIDDIETVVVVGERRCIGSQSWLLCGSAVSSLRN
jgi:hypothetical protein